MSFTRTIEDFSCEHCGASVTGSGYTNHCPQCLWSKHVDVEPGDRAESCGGMMEPIALEGSSPEYVLIHACIRCGAKRSIKVHPTDDTEALLQIAHRAAS